MTSARPVFGTLRSVETIQPSKRMRARIEEVARKTARLIGFLAPEEGHTLSALEHVRLLRSNRPLRMTAVLYDPSIVIVCQGRKRGFLGDEVYLYDAFNYLVLSLPLPFFSETEATIDEPLLAISLRLDGAVLADLLLAIERGGAELRAQPRGMLSTPMDESLADATHRLVTALMHPLEAQVMGPSILREIYFRVLLGPHGGALRTALNHQGGFGRIASALLRIQADFASKLSVSDLAREVHLSVPAFHAHFKEVTHKSPLQYLKAVRLHQARLLMIRDGVTAAHAAAQVGYAGSSQFGREFKRFFGRSPLEEVRCMKQPLTLSPRKELTRYEVAL